jgi:kynurenine formamidase
MLATLQYHSKKLNIDLSDPIDISMPLRGKRSNVNVWYVGKPKITPVRIGSWIGRVKKGASVNFNRIRFNPHAHGTHTECVGHITEKRYSINQNLKQFFFVAELITVAPEKFEDDFLISKKQIQFALGNKKRDAIIIRTLPNTKDKLSRHYSHTNWPYLEEAAAVYLKEKGIKHLLIDLPSVDREKDEGKLLAHNAFWNTNGLYALNIQIAPFENDATPSKPILYKTIE